MCICTWLRSPAAEAFYVDALGLALMQRFRARPALSRAGGYHHHLGLNVWAGVGAPPPRQRGAAGLVRIGAARHRARSRLRSNTWRRPVFPATPDGEGWHRAESGAKLAGSAPRSSYPGLMKGNSMPISTSSFGDERDKRYEEYTSADGYEEEVFQFFSAYPQRRPRPF